MKSLFITHAAATSVAALIAFAAAQTSVAADKSKSEAVAVNDWTERQIDADYAATAIRLRRELASLGEHFKQAEEHLSQIREQVDAVRARHAKTGHPAIDLAQLKEQLAAIHERKRMIQGRMLIAKRELSAADQRKQAAIAELRRQHSRIRAAAESSR